MLRVLAAGDEGDDGVGSVPVEVLASSVVIRQPVPAMIASGERATAPHSSSRSSVPWPLSLTHQFAPPWVERSGAAKFGAAEPHRELGSSNGYEAHRSDNDLGQDCSLRVGRGGLRRNNRRSIEQSSGGRRVWNGDGGSDVSR